ncbi:glutathione S-transferase family protein [Alphaproteobacteria bacterium KMM 3653]|uniref:Glutathione S-transferase family protein n=1 Tax=Harenicola maris TaxID=2841044 RepID=A0AAP2CNE3_9RHOB|nr:glutathione S-transferase family protein [Harenicola maris]
MIRLHHCHQTRSMRTLWLLHEMAVPFEIVVYPFDMSLKSPEFLALNPVGRVPALELDGAKLWETGAITQVLCAAYPQAGLAPETGSADWAEWLIWLHFAETISQHAAALTQQHIALFDDAMRSPVVTKLEAKRLAKCYGAVEARLEGREFLLDTGFSAADVSVGQAIYMGRHFAQVEPFARVSDWMARLEARPAYQASLPPPGADLLYAQDFYPVWQG